MENGGYISMQNSVNAIYLIIKKCKGIAVTNETLKLGTLFITC